MNNNQENNILDFKKYKKSKDKPYNQLPSAADQIEATVFIIIITIIAILGSIFL